MYEEPELFMATSEGVGMSHQSNGDTPSGVSRARTGRRHGLTDAWGRLGAALQDAATRDPQVREAMHAVGAWLHDLAGEAAPPSQPDRTDIDLALVGARPGAHPDAIELDRPGHVHVAQRPGVEGRIVQATLCGALAGKAYLVRPDERGAPAESSTPHVPCAAQQCESAPGDAIAII